MSRSWASFQARRRQHITHCNYRHRRTFMLNRLIQTSFGPTSPDLANFFFVDTLFYRLQPSFDLANSDYGAALSRGVAAVRVLPRRRPDPLPLPLRPTGPGVLTRRKRARSRLARDRPTDNRNGAEIFTKGDTMEKLNVELNQLGFGKKDRPFFATLLC